LHAENNDTQFKLLQMARKAYGDGNERIRTTTPPIITAGLKLARRLKAREHYEDNWSSQSSSLFKFLHSAVSTLFEKVNGSGAAELALRLLPTQRAEARKLADAARKQNKKHARALYVLAMLARRAADTEQEKKLLEEALDRDNPDSLVVKALGKLYYDAGEFNNAADVYELGRKFDPYDSHWLQELARAYAQTNDPKKQISVLRDLVPLDADDLDRRVRLARLLAEQKQHAEAEKYARQALEIDVTHAQARELLYKALQAQNKADELKRLKALLEG